VHVPDPLSPSDVVADTLGAALAPGYRVISVDPRRGQPYQVQAADLLAMLVQFGFAAPVLVGDKLGCVAALLVAAWHPGRVGRLVLIDPTYDAPPAHADSIEARALSDCPPDWPSLRGAVQCAVLVRRWHDASDAHGLEAFLQLP
jgi:pimeloyl-ACP methyl ester carboxylesterase